MENFSGTLSRSANNLLRRDFGLMSGAGFLLQGLRMLLRPGLRRYLIVPLIVNVIVFTVFVWLGLSQFNLLLERFLPETSWLYYFRWLLWPLFALVFLLLIFYTFTAFANLLAAPFNGMLAARVEQILTGSEPPAAPENWVAGIAPGLYSELRKLIYFLIRAVPLLLLLLVPGVQVAVSVLWIVFNAWFFALEYLDYPMSNHGLRFREQRQWVKKSRFAALGFGGAVACLMLIPVFNFAAMPAAVAGATIFWCNLNQTNRTNYETRDSGQ